jgi:hypothetical protein
MWGKKVRVYYHGIPFFCVNCYEIGHNRNECPNKTISWKDNINYLLSTGISSEIFGSWIDSNVSTTRVSQSDVPQPFFETPKTAEKEQTVDEDSDDIDFANLPPKVVTLLKKLSSTPKSTSKNNQKSDSKFKAKNRQQDYFRGRGRGRGNRGRGRGNDSSNRGRGSRGRGRGQF